MLAERLVALWSASREAVRAELFGHTALKANMSRPDQLEERLAVLDAYAAAPVLKLPEKLKELTPEYMTDLIECLRTVSEKGERALVLTLTKRSSEDLADYLRELKFKVRYIHSELNTFERAELIRDLRKGDVQATQIGRASCRERV